MGDYYIHLKPIDSIRFSHRLALQFKPTCFKDFDILREVAKSDRSSSNPTSI
jgi:hypothetical protein